MESSVTSKGIKKLQRIIHQPHSQSKTGTSFVEVLRRPDRDREYAKDATTEDLEIAVNAAKQKGPYTRASCNSNGTTIQSKKFIQFREKSPLNNREGEGNKRQKIVFEHWRESSSESVREQHSSDSEPIRIANRRRKKKKKEKKTLEKSQYSPSQPPTKRARKCGLQTEAQFPFSKESLLFSYIDEIKDSYEEEKKVNTSLFGCVTVEIPIYDDFDRDAYAKVSATSTQSTTNASEQEQSRSLPYPRVPSVSRFYEDCIPDSQESLGLSSYGSSLQNKITARVEKRLVASIPGAFEREEQNKNWLRPSPKPNISARERQLGPTEIPCSSSLPLSENSYFINADELRLRVAVQGSAHSSSAKESTGPGSTVTWQGAQTVPAFEISLSQSSKGLDFEVFQEELGATSQVSDQEAPTSSVLSQCESNSRRSTSQKCRSEAVSQEAPSVRKSRYAFHSAIHKNFKNAPKRIEKGKVPNTRRKNLCLSSPIRSLLINKFSNPQPPRTPRGSSMADLEPVSNSSKISYADQMKAAREKVRAMFNDPPELISIEDDSPPALSHISGQALPVRENIIEAATPSVDIDEMPEDDAETSTSGEVSLRLPKPKPNEYVILLPIVSMVREIYESAVMKNKREIQSFLRNDNVDPVAVNKMDDMIEQLKLLTDHQDLITEVSHLQVTVSDEHQAKWAATCSSKCLFIQNFLDKMRGQEKHVAILARPGRMLDILESIVRWGGFIYERPDRRARSNGDSKESLRVTLLSTSLEGGQFVVNRADAVIAFDETYGASESYSSILRSHLYESGKLSPLISLVVAYSAEHIELCLQNDLDPINRRLSLVDFVTQTRQDVGKLSSEFPGPEDAAAAVALYLQNDTDKSALWPLPENPNMDGLQAPSIQHMRQASGSATQSQDHQFSHAAPPQVAMKRPLRAESISEIDAESTKRVRMTPTPGDVLSSGDVTRVSDSVSSRRPASTGNSARDAIVHLKAIDDEQSKQMTSLLQKVGELEAKLQSKESTEERLRKTVKDLENHLFDHVSTIKKFQPKLQQAIADRGKFQEERDAAQAKSNALTQAISLRQGDIARLTEEKVALEKEAAAARAALANSAIPEAAALAQAQQQALTLKNDQDRLEKRIASLQRDFDFTRDAYQQASSHTTELTNKVLELTETNAILARKASENTVRIAEIQRSNESHDREEKLAELEALLRDREMELRRKSEELKAKTNGRRETRGTSVPRSPRMGGSGAMSPRPGFSRTVGGGNRSRGASPAPVEFRDAMLFPPSGLSNARWGHLT